MKNGVVGMRSGTIIGAAGATIGLGACWFAQDAA